MRATIKADTRDLTDEQRAILVQMCEGLDSPESAFDMALEAAEAGGFQAGVAKVLEMQAVDEATRVDELVTELTQRGPTYSGGDDRARETALEWRAQGFDRGTAEPWLDIGIWEPDVAAAFRDRALRPATVQRRAREAGELLDRAGSDILYAICNGDLRTKIITQE